MFPVVQRIFNNYKLCALYKNQQVSHKKPGFWHHKTNEFGNPC